MSKYIDELFDKLTIKQLKKLTEEYRELINKHPEVTKVMKEIIFPEEPNAQEVIENA